MTPSPKTRNRVADGLRSYFTRELDDVEARWLSEHYVLVDDKIQILTAVKEVWGKP